MKWREVAKFASGFEAFHALMHASLWLSGTSLNVLGISFPSQWSGVAALIGMVVSITLACFGWKQPQPSS